MARRGGGGERVAVAIANRPSKNCPAGRATTAVHEIGPAEPLVSRGKPAFVDLEMANRGPQQRRFSSRGTRTAQHIAQNLIALGAQSGIEVTPHRRAEIAATLGQHRTALFAVPLARREP